MFLGIKISYIKYVYYYYIITFAFYTITLQGHTGEYIKDCFENITSEFSIDKSQIVNFSTDNGSNMVAAVNLFLGAKKRIPCVAHTINLIIDEVLKKNANFLN